MSGRLHQCQALEIMAPASAGFRLEVKGGGGSWCLCYEAVATEQAVREGEAHAIGEVMTSLDLHILYCPFCGEKLELS